MSDLGAVLVFLGVFFGIAVSVCTIMVWLQVFSVLSLAKKWMRVRMAAETMNLHARERTEAELHSRY